jgi:hypothetical protein
MTPKRLLHRLRFWRDWGRELSAEIDRRLRPLEEAGETKVIIDIWVLRQLLSRHRVWRPSGPLTRERGVTILAAKPSRHFRVAGRTQYAKSLHSAEEI